MHPPDQRLCALKSGRIRLDIILRLIIDLQLEFLRRVVQVIQQALVQKLPLVHLIIIDHQGVLIDPAHHIAGRPRPVKHQDRFNVLIPQHDSHAQMDAGLQGEHADLSLKPVQKRVVIRLPAAINIKPVCLNPACDPFRLRQKCTDLAADLPQHGIAELTPVHGIDGMELLNIQDDRVQMKLRMVMVQSGQPVMLRRRDQLPSLAALQKPAYPGQNHLRDIKGLCDKIRRPHLQRLQLRALIRGQDDDRNILQLLILLQPLHHLEAGHNRHIQVKENDGKLLRMPVDLIQCFLPILRIYDMVRILQNNAQRIPVDLMVIYDQDQLWPLDLF